MKKIDPEVVVVGGSNVDIKGYPEGDYIPHTSNPGQVTDRLGGVARNIAENLGILGATTALLSAVGKDHYGEELVKETDKEDLDLSGLIRSRQHGTGRYVVLHDETGEMVGAVSDMQVTDEITPEYLEKYRKKVERADFIVLDANPGGKAIDRLLSIAEINDSCRVVVDPVSVEKARKISPFLDRFDIITPNKEEASSLFSLEWAEAPPLEELAVKVKRRVGEKNLDLSVVLTGGREGLALVSSKGIYTFVPDKVPEEQVVDTTGAGDALTAAMVYSLLRGREMEKALQFGLRAAVEATKSRRTVRLDMKTALEK